MHFVPVLQTICVILSGILYLPPRTISKFFVPHQSSWMPRKAVQLSSFPCRAWARQRQVRDTGLLAEWGWQVIQNQFVWWLCVPKHSVQRQHSSIMLLPARGCWPCCLSPAGTQHAPVQAAHTSRRFTSAAHLEGNNIGGEVRSVLMSQAVLVGHRKWVCLSA